MLTYDGHACRVLWKNELWHQLRLSARRYLECPRECVGRPAGLIAGMVWYRRRRGGGSCDATVAVDQSVARRSRSALAITDTDERLIAALAIAGLSSSPKKG